MTAPIARRTLLQWFAAASALPQTAAWAADGKGQVRIADARLAIQVDSGMRLRLVNHMGARPRVVSEFSASETVARSDGGTISHFALAEARPARVPGGQQLTLVGRSREGLEKTVTITMVDTHPGVALMDVAYRHTGARPLALAGWQHAAHRLAGRDWWGYSGATHQDRRDWVQPIAPGYKQDNPMGMSASDYGGGTPVVDVWRREWGLAIGHLDTVPRLVSLPVRATAAGVDMALQADAPLTLTPGQALKTPTAFLMLHTGDCFAPLDTYRQLMGDRGIAAAKPPASAFEPIWCAWGYEREFSLDRVRATLPKVRELGLKWAVIDDGWQRLTGDWRPDLNKFPRGDDDMRALVADIKAQGLRPRLWIAPLAVAPGSDELHDHTDMLLLDADGAPQLVSWWNSFYLCPAYPKSRERIKQVMHKIIGDWGFEGLKIDGQHLNGVALCHNPAHKHARPEESVEQLSLFYAAMHEGAREANPNALVEICPCGTAYAFHQMPYIDQAPASDPLSSWQVRHKGKALRALMGPGSAYAGDHVELSDGGDDFASTVGIGAVVSTKFTWPVDPKPKDSFLLTPEREVEWRRWIGAYNRLMLPLGQYRGELYDIGFDKPETHAVQTAEAMHYAFYAPRYSGPVALRGLEDGRWRVQEAIDGRDLGAVTAKGGTARMTVAFQRALIVRVTRA